MDRNRYESLDGLRGLAALSVCVSHFFLAYEPGLMFGQTATTWWGSDTPLAVLYNGGFAVSVFFVLSGFVVSNSAAKRHMPVIFNLIQRYFRLAIPVLAGTLFGWALLALLPHTVAELKVAVYHPWLLDTYDGFEPGPFAAVNDALIGVFKNGASQFDNVLWTMRIELIGSFAIYLLYGLVSQRFIVPISIGAALFSVLVLKQPEYAAFAIGALMREAKAHNRLSNSYSWCALFFAVVFGAMMLGYGARHGLSRMGRIFALGEPHQFWHVAAAAAMLYAVLGLPKLKSMLSTKPARFLGEISFGLYLVHVPMLYTVFVPLFLTVRGHSAGMAALLGLFLVCSLAMGYVFTLLIDKPTIGLIHQAQRIISKRRALHHKQKIKSS